MLLYPSVIVALAPVLVFGRPTKTSDPLAEFEAALGRRDGSSLGGSWPFKSHCDLSCASMPVAPTQLPSPAPDQTLSAVVLGRGTQNYTCDVSQPNSAPVPAGAVASLFDASCVAATFPSLLKIMPNIALQFPVPSGNEQASGSPANLLLAGKHYFLDSTTPYFDMDTRRSNYGVVAAQKADESTPPPGSPMGPHGRGNGSVAWLRLIAKSGDYSFKSIYRLNTAGGSPPKTCNGMPQSFTVDYAAEYWLWD